jgi:hypothetical protein
MVQHLGKQWKFFQAGVFIDRLCNRMPVKNSAGLHYFSHYCSNIHPVTNCSYLQVTTNRFLCPYCLLLLLQAL